MSGPSTNMNKRWDLIKKDIDTEEPAPANLYLGCKHETNDVLLNNGVKARGIVCTMGYYLKTIIGNYKELCYAATRERVSLRKWRPQLSMMMKL